MHTQVLYKKDDSQKTHQEVPFNQPPRRHETVRRFSKPVVSQQSLTQKQPQDPEPEKESSQVEKSKVPESENPSNRPFIETVDGMIRKKYTPEEIAQAKVRTEEERSKILINQLTKKGPSILYQVKSVFPFDFFPDELIVDTGKLSIVNRIFFFSESVSSIPYKNIGDVHLETSIFFATIKIVTTAMTKNRVEIRYLNKNKAIHARKIILGLMVMTKEGIDLTQIETKDLVGKVEQIGSAHAVAS